MANGQQGFKADISEIEHFFLIFSWVSKISVKFGVFSKKKRSVSSPKYYGNY